MPEAPILDRLRPHVPWGLTTPREERGQSILLVTPGVLLEVLVAVREHLNLDALIDVTCWDRLPATPRFEVVYLVGKAASPERLSVRVQIDGDAPVLPSAAGVYPGAAWPEREVYDMFGVVFEGHPDLRRILMPDDWEGYPLRRDYPLTEEAVEFKGHTPKVPSEIIPFFPRGSASGSGGSGPGGGGATPPASR
jgi:NADH-quinone oxidoreductase subunit C